MKDIRVDIYKRIEGVAGCHLYSTWQAKNLCSDFHTAIQAWHIP